MKRIICILLSLFIITSCRSYVTTNKSFDSSKDIVILYSNIIPESDNTDNVYSNINNTKEALLKETPNVTLVDTGNNPYIDKMNEVGYDYACFGLYDFSEGLNHLYENTEKAKHKYLLCSASYNGQTKDIFKKTAPYEIVDYDGIKVGYIGVFSPRYVEEKPEFFKEGDNTVVNVYNETEEVFYDTVQCSIDKAKDLGANYIVLLSNFDDKEIYSPYTLEDLIANLSCVDVVINGNTYTIDKQLTLNDKDNKSVLIVTNGPESTRFGKVTISNGTFKNEALD